MAANPVLALGRRAALALLIGFGLLLDPAPLMGHAEMPVCGAAPG